MYTAKSIPLKIIFHFAWKSLLIFFIYSFLICLLYTVADLKFIGIPFLPIGLIGTAVAFYVGFKNNSSYERLWEARKIWGNIVNLSRTFGVFVLTYIESGNLERDNKELPGVKRVLVQRHLAYINALRIRLRIKPTWESSGHASEQIVKKQTGINSASTYHDATNFLSEKELDEVISKANPVTQILKLQAQDIQSLKVNGFLEDFRHMEFGKIVTELYNQQGACERIKTFPFPRQYGHFSKVFVWMFILALPFGLIPEFEKLGENFVWLTIPFHMIIAWMFNTMEIVGDTSENPFDNGINDVPMTAICRSIEIDLLEMLGENNIPEPLVPLNNILM